MIYQIHHQPKDYFKSKETEMVMQFDADSIDDISKAIDEAVEKHPCPDGYQFLLCKEGAEMFVWTTKGESRE